MRLAEAILIGGHHTIGGGGGNIRRPTRADVLNYRGHLCNQYDALGKVIWTPALPGCPSGVRKDWLSRIAGEGGSHVPFGSFEPGETYPGIGYINPDWTNDPAAIRGLMLEILDTPTQYGHGLIPTVFLDGGGDNPRPKLDKFYPVMKEAGADLWDSILTVPCGWEPVVGAWRSSDVSYGLEKWHDMVPEAIIGYHGSPERLVGSSNPLEEDDPWQGGESIFYTEHGGQHINLPMYQTPHGRELYEPCTCPRANEPFGHEDDCPLNRYEDYVSRIIAGFHGWKMLPFALWETIAYEFFRYQVGPEQAGIVARRFKQVPDKWNVVTGYGNGLPAPTELMTQYQMRPAGARIWRSVEGTRHHGHIIRPGRAPKLTE